MLTVLKLTATALLLAVLCGCGGWKGWLRPAGTVEYQRYSAVVHDPYPDNDLGPEVIGGRPRDYEKPLPEAVRNRSFFDGWWQGY